MTAVLLILAYFLIGFVTTVCADYFDIVDVFDEGTYIGTMFMWPVCLFILMFYGFDRGLKWLLKKTIQYIRRSEE